VTFCGNIRTIPLEGNVQGCQDVILDEKFRLRIPNKFRSELGERFVIFHGLDDCLSIMSVTNFEKYKAPLHNIPHSDIEARRAARAVIGTVENIDEDSQMRFVISAELREIAGIDKQIRLIGYLDTLEVWAHEKLDGIDFGKAGSVTRAMTTLSDIGYNF
jgi:MraZ protein